MKRYTGERTAKGVRVEVNCKPLDPRHDIKRFSEGGIEWGYVGAEPAQLSLAILADLLNDEIEALRLHQHFLLNTIRYLDNYWELTSDEIHNAIGEAR